MLRQRSHPRIDEAKVHIRNLGAGKSIDARDSSAITRRPHGRERGVVKKVLTLRTGMVQRFSGDNCLGDNARWVARTSRPETSNPAMWIVNAIPALALFNLVRKQLPRGLEEG